MKEKLTQQAENKYSEFMSESNEAGLSRIIDELNSEEVQKAEEEENKTRKKELDSIIQQLTEEADSDLNTEETSRYTSNSLPESEAEKKKRFEKHLQDWKDGKRIDSPIMGASGQQEEADGEGGSEDGRQNGENGGNNERTRSGIDPNTPIKVIVDSYSDRALEQKRQIMIEVADHLVRDLTEQLGERIEGIAQRQHELFMEEFGRESLKNQQAIIEGLQAAKFTAEEWMDAVGGHPQSSLDRVEDMVWRTDREESGLNKRHIVRHFLAPGGHLTIAVRNISNILRRGGEVEDTTEHEEWLDDLRQRVDSEEISYDDAYTEIKNNLTPLKQLHQNVSVRAGVDEEAGEVAPEEEREGQQEESRLLEGREWRGRGQIENMMDIAEGIAENNPDFAEDGNFPIFKTEKDENGNPVRVGPQGRTVRHFNEENFLRWVRDRMLLLHNEDPDNPNVNFFSISIDLPQFYRAIVLQQMLRDPGRYFSVPVWEQDENGNWVSHNKVYNNLAAQVTRHAWLVGAIRGMDISYRQAMPMDTRIGETLMNIFQSNTLTKDADEGIPPLGWITTYPEHFSEETGAEDMNVGEAVRTTLLVYRSLTDYPELEKLLGRNQALFKKDTIMNAIKNIMREEGRPPERNLLSRYRLSEINSWFDENGNLKTRTITDENGNTKEEVDPDIQIAFTDFLNFFEPENDAAETKIVINMIQQALEEKYVFEGEGGRTDTQSISFSEITARFLSRIMLFGGRNDRGAAAMDASAKVIRLGQNRRRKHSSTSAGASGNPFDSTLLEAAALDFLESVQTTESYLREKHLNIADQNNIFYQALNGERHRLEADEEIIEVPEGYELVETDDGMAIQAIEYELEKIELADNEMMLTNNETNEYIIYQIDENRQRHEVLRAPFDEYWMGIDEGQNNYLYRPNFSAIEGNVVIGKVIAKRDSNEVVRRVDKQSPIEVRVENKHGIQKAADDEAELKRWDGYKYKDSDESQAGDADYVVYEVKFDEDGSRKFVENTFHHETILDVFEMLEEANNNRATYQEKMNIIRRLKFKEDSTRQLASNQYNRAFEIFLMMNDAKELKVNDYTNYSREKGFTVNRDQLQEDFTDKFIKTLRYAFRTWGDLDFARIERGPDPDNGYETYKYMHVAERIFGKQVIEVFRNKEGVIDWDYFNTQDGKAALFKTYAALYMAAQIWDHRNKESAASWMNNEEVLAYLDAVSQISGGMDEDREDFTNTKITKRFFGDFKINRLGEEKNYMDILKKASMSEPWRIHGISAVFDLLEALIKGSAESFYEGMKQAAA